MKLQIEKNDQLLVNSHTQKVIQKIEQLLYKHISNSNSKQYLKNYLYPTTNSQEILQRQQLLKELFSTTFPELRNLKNISPSSSLFSKPSKVPFQFFTCDITVQTQLEEYITIRYITEKELEEIEQTQDYDEFTFVVSDERYLGGITQLRVNECLELIQGYHNYTHKEQILLLIENLEILNTQLKNSEHIFTILSSLFNLKSPSSLFTTYSKFRETLNTDITQTTQEAIAYIQKLPKEIELKNQELKNTVKTIQLELMGDDLIEVLQTNDISSLQKKIQSSIQNEIQEFEKKICEKLKTYNITTIIPFKSKTYPLELDEESVHEMYTQIEQKEKEVILNHYFSLSSVKTSELQNIIEYLYCFDLVYSLTKTLQEYSTFAQLSNELNISEVQNIFIKQSSPISYALNTSAISIQDTKYTCNQEKISILTGANSGGKTTLLELLITSQYLTQCGFPLQCKSATLPCFEEIIYLKKFSGTQGSGAFEQTIREFLNILSNPSFKLLLIDEFEAITEPSAAATILTLFLEEISKQDIYCIAVSHLGKEIKRFIVEKQISTIRIDGISAKGLDEKGNLITNHQPEFNSLGKSTPELILQKIYNDETFFKNKSSSSKKLIKNIINGNIK